MTEQQLIDLGFELEKNTITMSLTQTDFPIELKIEQLI